MLAAPPSVHPWPIGVGPRYQPQAANAAVLRGARVGELRCAGGARFRVHVELFAHRRVIIVPPGIGRSRAGCRYPLATDAPTGVVDVLRGEPLRLRDLFRVWGRRLGADRLLSFRGRVSLFVDGKRRLGAPGALVLRPGAEIVLEVDGYLPPHPSYLFPPR